MINREESPLTGRMEPIAQTARLKRCFHAEVVG